MNPKAAVLIMINNYFHDVATAMLLSTGIIMWIIMRHYVNAGNDEMGDFVLVMHRRMKGIMTASLIWITVGAVPRILTFTKFEWQNALEKQQIFGLILKHIMAFVIVVSGAMLWIHLNRMIKAVPASKARQVSPGSPSIS